jgi:hypothetical protein
MGDRHIIIIAGPARSFSSLTAGILHFAGAWGQADGFAKNFNEATDGGQEQVTFENIELLNAFSEAATGFKEIPFVSTPEILATCLRSIVPGVFDKYGAPHDKPVFLKHPAIIASKGLAKWPLWHSALPDAQWIIVRRPTEEIERSHYRTYKNIEFDNLTVLEQIPIMQAYFNALGTPYFEIWPGQELKDSTHSKFKEMVTWAGLEWNAAVEKFIQPQKRRFNSEPAPPR